MIYLFYSAIALAAVISIGTIKSQMAHIEGLKVMYKEESRKAHLQVLETLKLKSELKNLNDIRQTWATRAHELNDDMRSMVFAHTSETEELKQKVWAAQQFRDRVREQKRRSAKKIREAKRNA